MANEPVDEGPLPSDRSEAGAAGYSVHPDQRFRHEFYEAFRAWFMQSGCDFWSECDAPEALAAIAVEIARQSLVDDRPTDSQASGEAECQ